MITTRRPRSHTAAAVLVLIETVVRRRTRRTARKLMDLIMLAMNGGRERTVAEYETPVAAGAFTLDRVIPSHTPYSFVEATPR